MKYTHITLDVGAAEKHKTIWINPDEFKDVIYLGNILDDFMHFFSNWKVC